MNFYGHPGDGYPVSFGMCAGVIVLATIIFVIGKSWYRIVPPAGVFLPAQIVKTGLTYTLRLIRNKGKSTQAKIETAQVHGEELLGEFLDMIKVIVILIPAMFFWMAFDQSGSSWYICVDMISRTIGKA